MDSNINRIQNIYGDYHAFYNDVGEDVIQKIKQEKDVKSMYDMMKFGNLVSIDNGTSMIFLTYNKEFLDFCSYKLLKENLLKIQMRLLLKKRLLKLWEKSLN